MTEWAPCRVMSACRVRSFRVDTEFFPGCLKPKALWRLLHPCLSSSHPFPPVADDVTRSRLSIGTRELIERFREDTEPQGFSGN